MPSRYAVAGLALMLACPALAEDFHRKFDASVNGAPLSMTNQVPGEAQSTRLIPGDRAPSFSYLTPDGAWHRSSELTQGPLLLVFGASVTDLEALEQERGRFLELGVTPVAVLDMRTGQAAKLSRRLKLSCAIVCDPLRAIADLYNSLDPWSLRHAPSYFVVDDRRVIRALSRGSIPPAVELLGESARALGKLLPETGQTSSS
jgi:peroxiredoxin